MIRVPGWYDPGVVIRTHGAVPAMSNKLISIPGTSNLTDELNLADRYDKILVEEVQ